MTDDSTRLAVLIDADNTSAKLIGEMFEELAGYGTITVKRAYGDWTNPHLNGWREVLLGNAISPQQQFAYTYGKNATDSALIIDAMDLLYSGNVEGFAIVEACERCVFREGLAGERGNAAEPEKGEKEEKDEGPRPIQSVLTKALNK